jgi:hypothetical protein
MIGVVQIYGVEAGNGGSALDEIERGNFTIFEWPVTFCTNSERV